MKRIIIIIILALIIAFSIVAVKHYVSSKLPELNVGLSGAKSMQNIEYLFIGSSMFRRGLDIYALEKSLGNKVFILVYSGNQPILIEEEIKCLLNNNVKIETLCIDMYAYSLIASPAISDKRLIWQMDFSTKMDVYNRIEKAKPLSWLERYSYFIRANNEYMLTYPISSKMILKRYYKGGSTDDIRGMDPDNLPIEKVDYLNKPPKINPYQKEAINKLINIAEKNKIKLVFIETPKHKNVADSIQYRTIMKQYINILNEQRTRYILADTIDFDNSKVEYFTDYLHLSSIGQTLYTKNLCAYWATNTCFK